MSSIYNIIAILVAAKLRIIIHNPHSVKGDKNDNNVFALLFFFLSDIS